MDFPSCNLKSDFTVWPSDELSVVAECRACEFQVFSQAGAQRMLGYW